MKKIYILLSLSSLVWILSCKKPQGITVDTNIYINVVNKQSQNLLSTPSVLNMGNIEAYFVENGVARLFYDSSLGTPKGFDILGSTNEEVLRLYPNTTQEDFPITLIKFGSLGTDTIKCQYKRTEGDLICTKVWLNGQLKYTYPGERVITVIK